MRCRTPRSTELASDAMWRPPIRNDAPCVRLQTGGPMRWKAMHRLLLATMLVLTGSRTAWAIGHYAAGLLNARDFFLPPPGVYFANYTYWYHSSTFKDRNGSTVDEFTVNVPGVGPRTVKVDTTLDLVTVVPALM